MLVGDNVSTLQTASGAEAEFFQRLARQGFAGGRAGVTQQGIYCFTARGDLLAADNSRDPERVRRCLDMALARWRELPQERRTGAALDRAQRRGEDLYPRDGLVLRLYSRDIGENRRTLGDLANPWNTDTAWFTAAEVRQVLPRTIRAGAVQEWPAPLSRRLARFHLVDGVLGQPMPFPDRSIDRASMRTEVVRVDESRVTIRFSGEMRATDGNRSLASRLLGRASYDSRQGRFTSVELVATAARRGSSHRAPYIRNDTGSGTIGFLFLLAADTPVDRVAPALFAGYGW